MQITPYALQMILRSRVRGFDVSGYTTKPGAGLTGLFEYSRNVEPHGKILGYTDFLESWCNPNQE